MTETNDQSSPAHRLAEKFAGPLSQSRTDLLQFSHLHQDFIDRCFAAIDAKKLRLEGPVTGEIFPHLVAEGLKLEDKDRRIVAAAWLALYGYICLVDYELDQKGYLNGPSSIAASALLAGASPRLAATPRAQNAPRYSWTTSTGRSRASMRTSEVRTDPDADRARSDMEKNRAVVAAIAGFCAAAGEADDRLIRSAEAMLGPLQLFDDLQDLQEDYHENNITPFVRIVQDCIAAASPVTQTEMYRVLIKDQRTSSLLRRAADAVERAILILDANRDQALVAYLAELRDRNAALIRALADYQIEPPLITEPEVMQRIEQIATAS